MDACRANHVETAMYLLDHYKANLGKEDVLGRQAIHHAAQAGALLTLEWIISRGADVNKRSNASGTTPLHYAAKEGQAGAVSLLLMRGALPAVQDSKGRRALDLARTARDSAEAVSLLTQAEDICYSAAMAT